MADKLSKFNIKGTLVDVIDAEARASIAELSEDVSGMASDVSSAVSTAEDAQTTANGKLSPSDAWKIGVVSATRNSVTVAPGTAITIQSGAVTGNNVTPLFAYCSTTTQLACIRLYTESGAISAVMYNVGSQSITGNVTINIVYAYK